MTPAQSAAVVVTVAVALGLALAIPALTIWNGSQDHNPLPNGSSVTNVNGLRLELSLNATRVSAGGSFMVNVSEYNALRASNNVSASNSWAMDGFSLGACGTQIYPFGIAVLKGNYSYSDFTSATPLQVYQSVPCPLFIRLITGYYFSPQSVSALIMPSSNSSDTVQMSYSVTIGMQYSGVSDKGGQPLGSGVYTVVAGDEWGTAAILHLVVK